MKHVYVWYRLEDIGVAEHIIEMDFKEVKRGSS
jgi:hypothetical protein